ncbi:MAG: ADP-ribosylglycohydrolase family protein, partial [Gemmataceae bacterium]
MIDIPLDAPAVTFDDRLIVFLPPDWAADAGAAVRPARFITAAFDDAVGRVAAGEGVAAVTFERPDVERCRAVITRAGGLLDEGTPWIAGGPRTVAALRKRDWSRQVPTEPPPQFRPERFGFSTASGEGAMLARARGCLMGQFAGDALGGLVEFDEEAAIRRRYPAGVRDLADGGVWHNLAGQPTDDSELALMLARSIVQAGRYDEALALSAYADWVRDPQTFDIGMTTARALRAVQAGATHEQRLAAIDAHAGHGSEANGSLMRASPLGVFAAGRGGVELARRD